jgi:nucleoside 2-deoxyribosyltransferase
MKNLLILWALPDKKEDFEKYNIIINICKKYWESILSPINTKEFNGNDFERFERAMKFVKNSDLIIAEMSKISTGQWFEIWIAYNLKIPIIVLAKEKSKVSGLIKWNPNIKDIIFYDNFIELEEKLSKSFN